MPQHSSLPIDFQEIAYLLNGRMLQLRYAFEEAFSFIPGWTSGQLRHCFISQPEFHRGIKKIEELVFKEKNHISCSTWRQNSNLLSPSPSSHPPQGHQTASSISHPALLLQVTTGTWWTTTSGTSLTIWRDFPCSCLPKVWHPNGGEASSKHSRGKELH